MGKALKHIIEPGERVEHEAFRTISYGKCTRSPYAENNLWFVRMRNRDDDEYTFLVTEQYACPSIMDEWRKEIHKWQQVSHKVFVGSWCDFYECLWEDVPVFQHQLPNGRMVKYGYCRTQSSQYPERELWYVAFQNGATFVVDHICAKPDFINRMGSDSFKWEIICWGRLEDEVEWAKLQTGTREGGFVRSHTFALDSPYRILSLDEIETVVKTYEEEIPKLIKHYKLQWTSLDDHTKAKYIRSWEKERGRQIIPVPIQHEPLITFTKT